MRLSSSFVAASAVAILSTALLSGTAMSQTAGSATPLPGVTVVAPKHVARPSRSQPASRPTVASRPTRPTPQTPSPAQGSVMARLAALEKTSSNCTDGCQTSFKYGNQPWNGCSTTGDIFSATCRNVRNFKTYAECRENGLFLGWRNNEIWWYCSSLGAGQKYQVAELKRPRP